jgi:hypothetical protein
MKQITQILVLVVWISLSGLVLPHSKADAQGSDINWSRPINLSNSKGTSTDPFLLADPAGVAHLFWAEKKGETPGNQADTILYTSWDGFSWSQPVDIFLSPLSDGNPMATFPRAIMVENGRIHLIWMSQPNYPYFELRYSSVLAWEAGEANAWEHPTSIALDLTGQKYSADIVYNPIQGLHVAYARGFENEGGRGVAYIHSTDSGATWSEPMNIYIIPDSKRGASDVRLLLYPPNRIYVSWTEWDNSGNGQAVYFSSSGNNGKTWGKPFPLAVRRGDEYERDWNNMALLGPNRLVSVWEGGFRAYRGSMVSEDGGATWTQPVDAFPWLIGDNGSVEFVRDGSDRLHLFLANRVREGFGSAYGDKFGLWHSVWHDDDRWSEPTLQTLNGGEEGMTNPKVTVIRGNQIVAVWYGSQIYEIMAQVGEIKGAAEIPPKAWNIQPAPTTTPTQSNDALPGNFSTATSTSSVPLEIPGIQEIQGPQENPGTPIYAGIFSAMALIILAVVFFGLYNRTR